MFQLRSLLNRRSLLGRPPTTRCQEMDIDDEITAKATPEGSGAMKFALDAITSGSKNPDRKYSLVSLT